MAEERPLEEGRFRILRTLDDDGWPSFADVLDEATGERGILVWLDVPRSELDAWTARTRAREIELEPGIIYVSAPPDAHGYNQFVVLQRPPGETLSSIVQGFGWLDDEHGRAILSSICDALAPYHARGEGHATFFIAPMETIFVDGARVHLMPRMGLPDHLYMGEVSLTYAHAAFSAVHRHSGVPPPPDVDSVLLGLLAYTLFTGARWAPDGRTLLLLLLGGIAERASEHASISGHPIPPAWFDAWFARATAHDPAKRFADAREAKDALGRTPELAPPVAPQPLPPIVESTTTAARALARGRRVAVLAMLALILAVTAAWIALR